MALGVDYRLTDQWTGGFNVAVTLTAGAGGFQGWLLAFAADFTITQIWNAEIVSHVDDVYVVRNAAYNGSAPADGTVDFGFLASGGTDPEPDSFTLNGTLISDLPLISVADVASVEGASGAKAFWFAVTLSEAAATPVVVHYATANGTALAGSDYVATTGSITFDAGVTKRLVRVNVTGDATPEANETFRLLLTDATGAIISDGTGIGTIRDDDTPPALRINDAVVTEGDSGTSTATFTIRLSKAWREAVVFDYATLAGTAHAGSDFLAQSGSLTFAPGEVTKTVSVAVVGDRVFEQSERFTLELSHVTGATVADGSGLATIRDNDRPPAVRISDATVVEGDSGTAMALFTLTLDKAWHVAVSVNATPNDDTALRGEDIVGRGAVITFAPGETTKTFAVAVKGDTVIEGDETFLVSLSRPNGLIIADRTGIGTILDDDAPAPVHSALSTSGNQIVDAEGHAVRITGVNWFGFEDGTYAPHGLDHRNWSEMMDQMADLGFNTIRLPFSLEALQAGKMPTGIDYSKNPDLVGLSPIQIMDKIIDHAGEIGMRVLLDNHRSAAGPGPNGNGLWVDGGYTEQQWIDTWKMLAARYAGDPTVIGADLANEPHSAVWGGGGANDWAAAAERAGNAIQSVNSDWLIVVEGVSTYGGQGTWWGGNLQGVAADQVTLNVANKVVYSPHEYGNSIYPQSWFSDPAYPNNMADHFENFWGYIYEQNIAPVLVGEFGSKLQDPKDLPYLQKLLAYMDGDLDTNGTIDIAAGQEGISYTWWSWNPDSGDTGGILADDWTTPIQAKIDLLTPHLSDLWT
ncbi:cellulase family glycosylhydrolase [Roseomonas sp. HJA6]|uniref:cellulase n=1 Tax=Roseomonas alba TaxID=2846776 RepID=A0ABS7A8C4_9PROT|nr:cellulase family glycosylhydrolase [Neoroseomonas alba]MBW6398547.1 cellulase family glycosylhydrolase [Neoroseomonas alba]